MIREENLEIVVTHCTIMRTGTRLGALSCRTQRYRKTLGTKLDTFDQ